MKTGNLTKPGRCHELGVCQSLLAPSCPQGMCRRTAFEKHQMVERSDSKHGECAESTKVKLPSTMAGTKIRI